MVRVNLIDPSFLSDQHLIAEYNEILMLASYIERYPLRECEVESIPGEYCLGKGHMRFFKDKGPYLIERHETLKKEMRKRGFTPRKTLSLKKAVNCAGRPYAPAEKDKEIIKKRLLEKIELKPDYYRYMGEKKTPDFFRGLIRDSF